MRKKLPSRKQIALRRIVVALIVLFLVNSVMHLGLLLPRQALHTVEERQGTGWTRTVERVWTPEIHNMHLTYLSQNEHVTMLSSVYFTHIGWFPGFGNALDCPGGEPLYAGYTYMNRDERAAWYFFGRVDDPEIQRIEVILCGEDYDDMSHAYVAQEVRRVTDVEFLEQSGRRYFLVKDSGEWDYDGDGRPRPFVVAYDAEGHETLRQEIHQGNSSHYG